MKKRIWIGILATVAVLVIGMITVMAIDQKTHADYGRPSVETYPMRDFDAVDTSQIAPETRSGRSSPSPAAVALSDSLPGGGIGVSAVPGVAFTYSYAFRLPNANIAGVQEQHVQACEKLGLDRCRITGMRYTVSQKDDVRAMLAFKLAPDLARQFGKDGVAAIQKAQGSLVDAAISGGDVGTGIDQSRRRSASIESRIKSLEARLKTTTDRNERIVFQSQIDALRGALERETQTRTDAGEALANTPMVFQYNSGNALSTSAIGEAWTTSTNSFVAIIGLFIIAIGVLLPWMLLAMAAWLLVRRYWKPATDTIAATDLKP